MSCFNNKKNMCSITYICIMLSVACYLGIIENKNIRIFKQAYIYSTFFQNIKIRLVSYIISSQLTETKQTLHGRE